MALIDGIVSYWKLDVNNSNQVDSAGSNDGTVDGATYITSGKINGAYSFITNDKIDVSDSDTLDFGTATDFSVSAWFKTTNTVYGRGLILKGDSITGMWQIYKGINTIRGYLDYNNVNAKIVDSANNWNDGNWHLVILTVDRDTEMKIYVDNTLEGTSAGGFTHSLTNTNSLKIGTEVANRYWDGGIDEVAIWNRLLTSDERTELWNSGNGLQYPFTTGWSHKINGVTPAKINGIAIANIAKVNGIC